LQCSKGLRNEQLLNCFAVDFKLVSRGYFFRLFHSFSVFLSAEPLPLMDLCRRVIRQNVTKNGIAEGKIDSLALPKSIKEYLEYKDRRPLSNEASPTAVDKS
jgi:hypothetical protein